MGRKMIVRFVLVLCLAFFSLAVLLVLLTGTQEQVYAASSHPENGASPVHLAPQPEPARADAASIPAAPLRNGAGTPVITVCKTGCPYTSIQDAASVITAGGIVKVAQGTYTDTDSSNGVAYITKTITLRGGYTTTDWSTFDPVANPTILDGENGTRVILVASNVSPTIEGFHITNGAPSSGCGGGVYIGGGTTLQRNRIYDNASSSIGGGVCVFGGSPTLVNNLIYTNTASNDGGGVYIASGTSLLHHNTLYDNAANGHGGGVYISSGTPVISATIIVSNTASDGGGIYGAGGVMSYNDVWGNAGDNYGGGADAGSNSISENPRFVTPAGFDLRIQANSPCRDQVPLAQMAAEDYWGLARPFGDQADIGAHEFYPSLTCLARIESGQVYSTVQTAVNAATSGSLVRVAGRCTGIEVTGGTSQTVYISQALTLKGGYTATNWSDAAPDVYTTVLDAQGQGRVIYVKTVGAVEIEGFHIRDGFITGTVENGSGIYLSSGDEDLQGNYPSSAPHVIRGNEIYSNVNNSQKQGGGIYVIGGSAVIQDNDIYDNDAAMTGGGVHIADGDDVLVQDNDVHDNVVDISSGSGGGGGVYVEGGSIIRIQGNKIYSNAVVAPRSSTGADNGGGGVYIGGADSAVIQGNELYSNTATVNNGVYGGGGGMRIDDDDVWVENNEIHDNVCNGFGGGGILAIPNGSSSLTIRDNRIYNNTQNDGNNGGGGIYVYSEAPTVIERNDIHGNSASSSYGSHGGGGGIYAWQSTGDLQVRNNLIYSNTVASDDEGGGIFVDGAPTIDGNTIYGNSAGGSGSGGCGIYGGGSATIRNNIVVSNVVGQGVQGGTCYYCDIWGNTLNTGGIGTGTITKTPQFVNPGVDFHLQFGSPCRDAGDPTNYPADDYAGYARPFGPAPDMGAYEFYTGTCFAQIAGATHIYTTVQAALDAVTQTTTVQVAGLCQGAQPRTVGSATFTQTAYISQSLTLRGGYTVTNWTTPTAQTILDAQGQGRTVYITGTGAVTVDGFILQGGSAITGGGLYVATPLSPTVQNIIFHGNTANYGGGLASAGGNPRLYNNTFVTNTAAITGGGVYLTGSAPVISNTIVVSNAGGGIWAGSGARLAYNDVWANTGGNYAGGASAGATDFSAAPLFVNFAGHDFHLSFKSPCVHTADPGTALAWDFEGDGRPLGRGSDVGADEAATYADVRFAPFSWLGGVPGEHVVHSHVLTNTGSISDTFDLTHTLVVSGSAGWQVSYTPSFALVAGEATPAPVTVIVPGTAISGTWATVVITATSQANGDIYDVVSNTTMVNWNPGVELTPVYTEHVNAGTVMTYEHTLKNTGNAPDTFDIGFSSSYGWVVVTPTQVIDLAAHHATTVWVRVVVPDTAPGGLVETTVISASSSASGVWAVVTDTTSVNHTVGPRYVATTGDDTLNSCMVPGSPCGTIIHAVDQASGGDPIKVATGDYAEHDITLNENVTLLGGYSTNFAERDPYVYSTTVNAHGLGRVFYIFGSPTIEGFIIKGGATDAAGGGVYVRLGSPTIRRNRITGNTAVWGGGFSSNSSGTPEFWDNWVYGNTADVDGGGVYVSGGNPRIWHDTIYSNTANQGGGIHLGGGSPTVSNTIVVSNSAIVAGGGIYSQTSGATVDYNDVCSNTNGDYVGLSAGSHSTSANPLFVGAAAGDLHLQENSPCIDIGSATPVVEDIDGQPRQIGSAPDIGADEFRLARVEIEPDRTGTAYPGGTIAYTHIVTNTGNYTDTFDLTWQNEHGWDVEVNESTVSPVVVTLGISHTAEVTVVVHVPEGTFSNTVNSTMITVTSQFNAAAFDAAVDTTTVVLTRSVILTPDYISLSNSNPGSPVEVIYTHRLTNTGNYTDVFDFIWASDQGLTVTVAPTATAPLGGGSDANVFVTVTLSPRPTDTVLVETTFITAVSHSDLAVSSQVTDTTYFNLDLGVELSPDRAGSDIPGHIVTYTHVLTNVSNYTDTFTLASKSSQSWNVEVPNPLELGPGLTTTVIVTVPIPNGFLSNTVDTTVITATSRFSVAVNALVVDTTTVAQDVKVSLTHDGHGWENMLGWCISAPYLPYTLPYRFELFNQGNFTDTFDITGASSSGWVVTLSPDNLELGPYESDDWMWADVNVPSTTQKYLDTLIVTATSRADSAVSTVDVSFHGHYQSRVNWDIDVALEPNVSSTVFLENYVVYTHVLTNTGEETNTFDLAGSSDRGWHVTVTPDSVNDLAPGDAVTVQVRIDIDPDVSSIVDTTHITATARYYCRAWDSAIDTTTVARPHVTLSPDYNRDAALGTVITYTHILTNSGAVTDTYTITYASSLGWAVVTPTMVYTLPPGNTVPVTAVVSIPLDTAILSGTMDTLVITATSHFTDTVYDTARDKTTVPYAPGALLVFDESDLAAPNWTVTFTHILTNTGNYTETFDFTTNSEFAFSSVKEPASAVQLGPGEAYTPVVVIVQIPNHAAAGDVEHTEVLAVFSEGEQAVARDSTLVNFTAGTRYVATGGTDSGNNCLERNNYGPCATVQQAVDQALAGDEVRVAQGVYTDVHASGAYTQAVYLDKNLTLLGGYVNGDWDASPDPANNQTVLDAGGQGRVIYVALGVTATIEGFHLRNGYVAGDGAGIYIAAGAAPAVRRNFIYSNTAAGSGSKGGGVYYHYTSGGNLALERNIVYSNTAGTQGGGFYVYGSYSSGVEQHVWNNVLYHNTANDGGGLYLAGNSATVWNNTFYSNTATNGGGGVYLFAGSSAISNTIFASNSGYGIYKEYGQSGSPALDYNLVWENGPANFYNVSPGSNTITMTPGFVDAAHADFHLRTDSNAIGAGAGMTGSLPSDDLDGNQRPLPSDGQYDIGAYESGLSSKKTAAPYAPAGGTLTFTIAITNSGDTLRTIIVTDTLHHYLDYAGLSSTPAGSSSYSNHTVRWNGNVAGGTTALITVTTTVTDWLVAGTPITNVAQINFVPGSIVTTIITGTHGARYVALTGDDAGSNCMRPDMPCLTIQYAITQALAGDAVRVASGTYTGTGQVAYVGKNLALTGGYTPTLPAWSYNPAAYTTTLDAQGNTGVVITNSATASVGGFHIISGISGVAVHAATATISRCRIYSNTDGVSVTLGGGLTLVRSWVYNNSDDGVDVNGGSYTLINDVLAHNGAAGVRTAGSSGALLHDTFARNAAAGVVVSDTARFTNTVFYSHSVGVNVAAAGTAYLSNTLWYSNTANQGAVISSTNWYDQDPRFEDPAGMDYHVQPGSSVIDKGLDNWLSEDIDGEHRPLLQHPDLGADEFSLVILKHAPGSANPGQIITYSIMLQGGETGLVLTDTLDAYLTCTGTVACDVGSCGYLTAQRTITWTGDAPADHPVYITYTAQITSWLAAGERILNDALVLISGDPHNTNQVATTINALPGTRYVAVTGVDSDSGTGNNCLAQWKPCATVQYAVNQALAGDTVKVASGNYTGTGQVVSVGKSITLTGGYTTTGWLTSDPETNPTYLDGQNSGRVVVVTDTVDVIIDGFHLLNGSVSGDGGGIYVDGGATVTLANSRVYSNSASGTGNGGGVYAGSGALTLSQSRVYSNIAVRGGGLYATNAAVTLSDNRIYTNTASSDGGGVRIYSANSLTMERNVVLDNAANSGGGVSVYSTTATLTNNIIGANRAASGGDGLSFDGLGSGDLRHNTIADNGSEGVRVGNFTLALTNTILSGHTVGITTATGANVTADHTLWDGSGTYTGTSGGGSITTLGDVSGFPAYRDQAGMDYHITGSSAALGAGTDTGVSADIDGDNRASPPDIGADQYNLRVDRWASATDVAPCQPIVHTLVLTNVAASPISGVVLTDALPISVTYSSGSITYTAGSGGYLAGSRAITWSGDIAAQSSVYVTYTVNVNSYLADGTVVTFTATISDPVSTFAGNPLTVAVHTLPAAASKYGVGAVSPAGQATIGELVTYTVVYTVPAGHQTTDPLVVDDLPRLVVGGTVSTTPALAYTPGSLVISGATTQTEDISTDGGTITWTLNSVDAPCGAPTVATLTFNARVLDLSDNDAGDSLTDTLAISYDDGMSHRVITDEQTLTLVEPGLTLTHTAALTQNLGMGDSVVVTVTVANPGSSALYDVAITDTLSSGWAVAGSGSAVFTSTLSSIGASSVPVTFTARVNDDVGPAVTLTATAEAMGSSVPGLKPQERSYADTAPLTATTGLLDLEISKEGPAVRSPNQSIHYTIAYTNTGVVRAEGVQISDTLPLSLANVVSATSAGATVERAGQTVTWTLTAPLSRSVSGRIWITAAVSGAAPEWTVLTNTVAITTTSVESGTMNNSDLVTTTVRLPVLSITKTLDPVEPLTARPLTYTLTISNTGLGDATDLLISDTVPASTTYQSCSGGCGFDGGSGVVTWTLTTLPAGGHTQVSFTVLVGSDAYSGTAILNQTYGVACAQGVSAAGDPLTSTVPLWQELSLTPAAQEKSIMPGEQVVYTHTLVNWGTVSATVNLTVSNASPGWKYTLQPAQVTGLDVGAGAGKIITLTVEAPVSEGSAAAVVTATWQGAPTVYATAVDTATTGAVPVLSIDKVTDPAEPLTAKLLTYTLTISNTGSSTGTALLISDTVPSRTTYQSCSGNCGFDGGSGVVTWTLTTLPAGEHTQVSFTVLVGSDAYSGTAILNQTYGVACAQGVSAAGDPLTSTVPLRQELSLTPADQEKSIMPGEQVVYTHTLVNWGTVAATVNLAVSNASSGWTYTLQPVQVTGLGVGAGAGKVVTLTVDAPVSVGSAAAVVTATWQGAPTVYATAVDTTTIGCVPVSGVSIDYTPTAPRIGQTVTFTGTASGTAPLSYVWDFGDGNGDSGQFVTHAYGDDRSYNVQLTVTNCGASQDSAQRAVIVNPYKIYLPLVLRSYH